MNGKDEKNIFFCMFFFHLKVRRNYEIRINRHISHFHTIYSHLKQQANNSSSLWSHLKYKVKERTLFWKVIIICMVISQQKWTNEREKSNYLNSRDLIKVFPYGEEINSHLIRWFALRSNQQKFEMWIYKQQFLTFREILSRRSTDLSEITSGWMWMVASSSVNANARVKYILNIWHKCQFTCENK